MEQQLDMQEMLRSNKKLFDATILEFLPESTNTKEIQTLYDMMRDYPSRGGKGIRGSLCFLWCELFGGEKSSAILTASALELFQNWILIHDDIEDGSEMRRGLPALHKKYGVELAINAGDALHGKMWEMILKNRYSLGPSLTLEILSEFSQMLNETTEGQQMELSWNFGNDWKISEPDYLLMVTKKAAWYTCISPARLGLILSRATRKNDEQVQVALDKTIEFGTHLGIAFQIVDDVLNLTADESKYGKEILGDLYEGKRTLMVIHLLQSVNEFDRTKAIDFLSKPRQRKSASEMSWVFDLMKDSGSIDYAKNVASNHSALAMDLFDDITSAFDLNKRILRETRYLLEYLTSRDY